MNMHEAAEQGDEVALARLLAEGTEVDCRDAIGQTPLMLAAAYGGTGSVRLLLEHGADPQARESEDGRTALFYADNLDCLNLLLSYGADPHTCDENGLPALYCLFSADMIRALVAVGVDVNARNQTGDTALHMGEVLWSGRLHVIDCLVTLGADVNARDASDDTPLFEARDAETVDRLVALGAHLDVLNYWRQTPLHTATMWNYHEVVACLLRHGLNPNVQDVRGDTPLHGVRGIETTMALLAAGASTTIRNAEGRTPLQSARNDDVVEAMLANNKKGFISRICGWFLATDSSEDAKNSRRRLT